MLIIRDRFTETKCFGLRNVVSDLIGPTDIKRSSVSKTGAWGQPGGPLGRTDDGVAGVIRAEYRMPSIPRHPRIFLEYSERFFRHVEFQSRIDCNLIFIVVVLNSIYRSIPVSITRGDTW